MRRLLRCVSLLSLVSLAAACGSSGRGPTPGAPGTTSTSLPAQAAVLRGVPVQSFQCSPPTVPSGVPVPIVGAQAFLLCPLGAPGQPSKAVTVRVSDPAFAALVRALSAADIPATPGTVCAAYADLTQLVLAKTNGRVYQVSIPTDGCKHYQRNALDALRRARGG